MDVLQRVALLPVCASASLDILLSAAVVLLPLLLHVSPFPSCLSLFPCLPYGEHIRSDGNVYAAYPGFPSSGGAGSSFTLYESMAISTSCEAKEAAWAFVRRQLFPYSNVTGWYTNSGLPFYFIGFAINRETFEEQMRIGAEYWTDPYTGEIFKDANGEPVEYTYAGIGVGYPGDIVLTACLLTPSEAQLERFWTLYDSIDQITGRNDALLDIVMEQADVYFAGDKSLDETVRLIQNRASLYVNENR